LSKPLEHEVTVELVVVEVFVTDKEGNFVDNLTENDFEIYEDGKRVKIQYFAIVKPEKEILKEEVSREIKEAKKPRPPQKMKLVILFDNLNTNRFYLNSNWPQIEEMFKALSDKVEETMIMELNRLSGMRIIQPFTSDQNLLLNQVSKFRVDMWKEVEKETRRRELEDLEMEARVPIKWRFHSNPYYVMDCLREEERIIRRGRLSDSFGAFLAAVNYIRKFEGVKSVLIVSDGFHLEKDTKKGRVISGGHYGDVKKDFVRLFDPFKLFGGKKYLDQHEAFGKLLQLINEEKIIFYAFSPKGLKSDFSVRVNPRLMGGMFKDEMEQWSKELYTLEEIADETGGMYLRGEKKYENFVKELGRDLTHFYDISYAPPSERGKGGYHKIEVKVKKPGLSLRHRKGYSDFTEVELERKAVASAFLSPSFFDDIDFSCKTDFIALRGGYPQFWIRLKIPLDQFRSDEDIDPPEKLALMFGIKESTENKIHLGGRVIRVKDPVEKGLHTLYRAFITSVVKVKPGEYEARVILRKAGDQIGGWEDSLKIPDLKKNQSLSFINSIFGFLREEEEENTVPFSVSIVDGSLLLSQYRLYPFVENVFKEGRKVALFLQIYSPKEMQDFTLQFSIHRDENTILPLPSKKIESLFDEESKILSEVYLLDFQDIHPGDYQIKVKSPDGQIEKRIEIKIIQ